MLTSRRSARDERGAVLVLSSFVLVVLMAMAALLVDIGRARQERTHAQSAADAATVVKQYALNNLGTPGGAWSSCADTGALAHRPDGANTWISFDSPSPSTIRVRVPAVVLTASFANALGVSSLSVNAAAVASVVPSMPWTTFPVGVSAQLRDGKVCIENSGNDTSCSNNPSGWFGDLQVPRLASYRVASTHDELRVNFAVGFDHPQVPYTSGLPVCDGLLIPPCLVNNFPGAQVANHLNAASGNTTNQPTEGLVSGFSASTTDAGNVTFCGRLRRPDRAGAVAMPAGCGSPGGPTISVLGGTAINGRHVAYWMTPSALAAFYPDLDDPGSPGVESPANTPLTSSRYANGDCRLQAHLSGMAPGLGCSGSVPTFSGPLFRRAMSDDPRAGLVPVFPAGQEPGPATAGPIQQKKCAFLGHLYTNAVQIKAIDAWAFGCDRVDLSLTDRQVQLVE